MKRIQLVCDECGRKHGLMLPVTNDSGEPILNESGDPLVIGDRKCFLAWQGKRWTKMEEDYLSDGTLLNLPKMK